MSALPAEVVQPDGPQRASAVVQFSPAALLQMAVSQGADMAKLEKLMDLQERWEAKEARKAFNNAMAAFREEHVRVFRSETVKQGPLAGTPYSKLSDFVSASAPALAKSGLSATWRITKDDKDWIEVACIVRHRDGHQEEIRMGGAPDTGGAKNSIQARASTVSYLEKYTLKMALGLAEQNDDDDGNGGGKDGGGFAERGDLFPKLEAEAQKGSKALQEAWNALTKEQRVGMKPDLAGLKTLAAGADFVEGK